MSEVTVDELKRVAEFLHSQGDDNSASVVTDHAWRKATFEDPDFELAEALYLASGAGLSLSHAGASVVEKWLNVARKALEILEPAPEPRVFKAGDPEPEDRSSITLTDGVDTFKHSSNAAFAIQPGNLRGYSFWTTPEGSWVRLPSVGFEPGWGSWEFYTTEWWTTEGTHEFTEVLD